MRVARIHGHTINALVRKGWAKNEGDLLTVTEEGRRAAIPERVRKARVLLKRMAETGEPLKRSKGGLYSLGGVNVAPMVADEIICDPRVRASTDSFEKFGPPQTYYIDGSAT